jgi:ubiquinone/menaquinone biosynthesis C-methylase UbiE
LTGKNEKSGHVCPWWLAYSFDNPLRRIFHKPEKIFASMVRPGMTVADIGCGMGYFSLGLARIVESRKTRFIIYYHNKALPCRPYHG